MNMKTHCLSLILASAAMSPALYAQEEVEAPTFTEAVTQGKPTVNLRLRAETADQDGKEDATALTGRIRIGYITLPWNGFTLGAEMEYTDAVDENEYNAAGVTGDPAKSVIADPPSSELNQAYLGYAGFGSKAKAGRQVIVLDNARFVGDVGWRQNQQTYDGFRFDNSSIEGLAFTYAYINQVNRIFGSNSEGLQNAFKGDIHTAHAKYTGLPVALGAHMLLLDFDDAKAISTNTYGVYVAGSSKLSDSMKLSYRGDIAFQESGDENPNDAETMYLAATATLANGPLSLIAGYELLGSDEDGVDADGAAKFVSFTTPLATLHKFNGWADVFLVTPPKGLEDIYVGASAKLPHGFVAKVFYHSFSSDEGSIDYGDEVDLLLVKGLPLGKVIAKYANYSADEFGVDTERFSIEYNVKF